MNDPMENANSSDFYADETDSDDENFQKEDVQQEKSNTVIDLKSTITNCIGRIIRRKKNNIIIDIVDNSKRINTKTSQNSLKQIIQYKNTRNIKKYSAWIYNAYQNYLRQIMRYGNGIGMSTYYCDMMYQNDVGASLRRLLSPLPPIPNPWHIFESGIISSLLTPLISGTSDHFSYESYYASLTNRHRPGQFGIYNSNRFSSTLFNDRTKPQFKFEGAKRIEFDLEKHNLLHIQEQIKIFKGYEFYFSTIYRNDCAIGCGANRQVYTKLSNDLIESILTKTLAYFMDIDETNSFWNSDENIESFVIFIGMIINSGCLLPYHLAPALLETISNKKMTFTELEFFMEKMDSIAFNQLNKISPHDFKSLETNFETHEDYYRWKIIGSPTKKKLDIYKSISGYFELFDSFFDYDIKIIDKTFSGAYCITTEMVLGLTHLLANQEYLLSWQEFIKSLSEAELKQMLILFGNTTCLSKEYTIYVSDTLKTDIHIATCSQSVTLNKKLFENVEYLKNLKIYFTGYDQISDDPSILTNYGNEFETNQNEVGLNTSMFRDLPRHNTMMRSITPSYLGSINITPSDDRPTNITPSGGGLGPGWVTGIGCGITGSHFHPYFHPYSMIFDGDELNSYVVRRPIQTEIRAFRPFTSFYSSIIQTESRVVRQPIQTEMQAFRQLIIENKSNTKMNQKKYSRNALQRLNNIIGYSSRQKKNKIYY